MDCTALANCTTLATTPETERGLRFAEMLQTEPLRPAVYVDGPNPADGAGNPVVAVASQFQSLDFSSRALQRADALTAESPGSDTPFATAGREALQAQAEILRTVMMMEVMNSAKQGVTTLFQQQG